MSNSNLNVIDFHSSSKHQSKLPNKAGLGLKTQHFQQIIDTKPDIGFFEIHAENYLVPGGPFHYFLEKIRSNYPLSIHGVGLSIGSEQPLDKQHLNKLAELIQRYQPESFSEHLAWSTHDEYFYNDLLPVPYNDETLRRVCEHVDQVQTSLKRTILIENPSTYVEFSDSTMSETDFISAIIKKTGCQLLLDVNNVYVSCINHNKDTQAYINALPVSSVKEIHLAGFSEQKDSLGARLLIDAHGTPIDNDVWALYANSVELLGSVPTLIERDHDIPTFNALLSEAHQAEYIMKNKTTTTL
ncbi:UNVERIFIED_CONTAM: hypothetical protein GTU68_010903 [Idotea baltica]|nr:hypothetical protein [Idotea baltica]